MSVDLIRYDLLVQDALRAVVRRVLTDVARDGLPGDHHLYISFDTTAPGVRLSPRLKERYPEEMTIVLQHQFWDLIVTEVSFEVGLSFNGIPERLFVPFASLKGFFDPSVKFGLQFEPAGTEDDDTTETAPAPVVPIAMTRPTAVPTSVPNTSVPVTKPAASAPPRPEAKPAARTEGRPKGEAGAEARSEAKNAASKPAEAKRPQAPAAVQAPKEGAKESGKGEAKDDAKSDASGGAQVVRLDAFRKK